MIHKNIFIQTNTEKPAPNAGIKESILKRVYTIKERLYIEAKYLAEYGFGIGQSIAYRIDHANKSITVFPSDAGSNRRVAKTTQRSGNTVPVIDIKVDEIKSFFTKHIQVEVEIHRGKIIFSVVGNANSAENIISLEDAKTERQTRRNQFYSVDIGELAHAANMSVGDVYGLFRCSRSDLSVSDDHQIPPALRQKPIRVLSLFSGCGSFDLGFRDEGYDIIFANDRYDQRTMKDSHIKTYRHNLGDHIVMKDIMSLTESDIPEADVVVAGIPCVRFSSLNTINNIRDDDSDSYSLVEQTLNIIRWSKAKSFLFENVRNFLSVKAGLFLDRINKCLPSFRVASNLIDATTLGSPQKRVRAFVFGLLGRYPNLMVPSVKKMTTVGDAFANIEGVHQQDIGFQPTSKMLQRMLHVPPGGNVTSVPLELRAPNKKFSNYLNRLRLDGYAPTITHVQDDAFTHPVEHRYLTVRETARLFSLPDDFTFYGSPTAIFEMLKNAVDYKVSRFLAKIVKQQLTPLL